MRWEYSVSQAHCPPLCSLWRKKVGTQQWFVSSFAAFGMGCVALLRCWLLSADEDGSLAQD